jgi:hypothetical protein
MEVPVPPAPFPSTFTLELSSGSIAGSQNKRLRG